MERLIWSRCEGLTDPKDCSSGRSTPRPLVKEGGKGSIGRLKSILVDWPEDASLLYPQGWVSDYQRHVLSHMLDFGFLVLL